MTPRLVVVALVVALVALVGAIAVITYLLLHPCPSAKRVFYCEREPYHDSDRRAADVRRCNEHKCPNIDDCVEQDHAYCFFVFDDPDLNVFACFSTAAECDRHFAARSEAERARLGPCGLTTPSLR